MNTRSKTTWALALAAVTLSLTSACGSEIAPPSQDIRSVTDHKTADVQPEQGSNSPTERNLARMDFNDDGGY